MKNTKFIVKVDRGGRLIGLPSEPHSTVSWHWYHTGGTALWQVVGPMSLWKMIDHSRSVSLSDAVRQRADRTPTADYIDRLMAKQERRNEARGQTLSRKFVTGFA